MYTVPFASDGTGDLPPTCYRTSRSGTGWEKPMSIRRARAEFTCGIVALIAIILAQPSSVRAEPGANGPMRASSRGSLIQPLTAPAPTAPQDPLGDDNFARRPLFTPGKHLAVDGAARHEVTPAPAPRTPVSTLLFGLGGALVALGGILIARQGRRLA
jgi:hypothetical protein